MSRHRVALMLLLTLAVLSAGFVSTAFAHKPSDGYLTLTPQEGGWNARWDIALRDLEYALGLDGDGDGAITWGEVQARASAVSDYALEHLTLRAGITPCIAQPHPTQIVNHSDGAYVVLNFALNCPAADAYTLDYRLFFNLDPSHRGLLRVNAPGGVETVVLSPEQPQYILNAAPTGAWRQFGSYWREGVQHIWAGFDHMLFLLALLLPAVLRREHDGWRPAEALRPALWETAAIVTAFTAAHALTLTLAMLDIVSLPSRLVESVIALTVVLAALNNLFPVVTTRRWSLAFTLGLIHGFGFAGALRSLSLPPEALATALVGFNVGVETGQLVVAVVILPLAFALRQTWLYRRLAFPVGSAAVALLALVWCLERSLDLKLAPTASTAHLEPTPVFTTLAAFLNPEIFLQYLVSFKP